MSLKKHSPKANPLKPKRNFKDYLKFIGIALILIFLVEFVFFKGERPHITKMKQDYYANKAAQEQALEEALEEVLPPKIVFPETGEEYFEAPELILKDEQSLLREKRFNITKLSPDIKPRPIKKPKAAKKLTGKKAKIAIVIDDVGMNIKQSKTAINLPSAVTLAMLPYATNVRELSEKAKSKGHELIIHTPMEAMNDDVSLGSLALRSDMGKAAFKKEFNKIANSFDGYVGINNHMGSRLTQDDKAMNMLMSELNKRGLFFLDSKTIATSVAADVAGQHNIPHATRDVFLDHEETPEFVLAALKKTEAVARDHGAAIAIGHPKQVTMTALKKWIPTLERRGFELVPLSALVNPPQKPVIHEVKAEEVEKIEPAAGDNTEEIRTLNLTSPIKEIKQSTAPIKQIQMVKEGSSPRISYPVE